MTTTLYKFTYLLNDHHHHHYIHIHADLQEICDYNTCQSNTANFCYITMVDSSCLMTSSTKTVVR